MSGGRSAWLRQLPTRCADVDIGWLVRASTSEPIQAVIRRTARFKRHRDLILALPGEPGIASLLLAASSASAGPAPRLP
jgi:hypothetical protein